MQSSCEDFRAWSDSCMLTHLPTYDAQYTWTNGRRGSSCIDMRLDRSIGNDECLAFLQSIAYCTLTKLHFDHHRLLVWFQWDIQTYASAFRFHKMWLDHSITAGVLSRRFGSNSFLDVLSRFLAEVKSFEVSSKIMESYSFW